MGTTKGAGAASRLPSSCLSAGTGEASARAGAPLALDEVLETMSQGVAVFGPDLTLAYFNSHFLDVLDFPEGAIALGMAYDDLVRLNRERGVCDLVDSETGIEGARGRPVPGKPAVRSELQLPDGRVVSVRRTPLPRGGIVNTYVEITQRKQAEAELARNREMLQAILDNMADGIRVFDGDLKLTAFNRRAVEFFRYPPELFRVGVGYEDFVRYGESRGDYADDPSSTEERIERAYEAQGRSSEQTLPDGRILQKRRNPMPDGGFVSTYSDITDLKRAQQDLKEKAQALEQALDELRRSNTELEQFAYVASHDLQEPLRMVGSYCQLLARRYGDQLDEDGHEFIGYAVDGAQRMQNLINDLLAYSRVGTRGKPLGAVRLDAVLDAALGNLKIAIEEADAEITRDPLPTIHGDDVQLTQLFQNLIGNALKFRGDAAPRIHVGAVRHGERWRISVADNGIGIDPAYFDRIFLIFQRLHERGRYPGTGIGLAVCKKIVERHGGQIEVESASGAGSTFSFTLAESGDKP